MAFNFSDGSTLTNYLVRKDFFDSGSVWSWGSGWQGQLGDNTSDNYKSSPVQIISGGSTWKRIVSGYSSVVAIKTDGTLWLWGANYYGELGNNNTINTSSPIQTISGGTDWKQISAGQYTMAAIKTDGTLWLCGANYSGQLGDNTLTSKSSPIQTVSGGTNWKQVSISNGGLVTAAIKTDGSLWLWGSNSSGQLGDDTTTSKSSPVQTVSGGTNWKQVSTGGFNSAAIKTDGTLWLWGNNISGQLGDNTFSHKSSPVQTISGGTTWKQVSVGSGSVTAAIKTDGTLWLWGDNRTYGQLGDNSIVRKSSPVQTISGGTNWKQVSIGGTTVCTIKE